MVGARRRLKREDDVVQLTSLGATLSNSAAIVMAEGGREGEGFHS